VSPEDARAMTARQMDAFGESVTIRRVNPSPTAATDRTVRAKPRELTPGELTAGIDQRMQVWLVLAEDLEASGFPLPLKTGGSDKVVSGTRVMNVEGR
jgi:hypothetical protein